MVRVSSPNTQAEPQRYHGIDGMRAVAVIAVIVYHVQSAWLPGGFVGVDIFFAISGYVVCGSLLRSQSVSVWRDLIAFYARRFARIYPALLLTLLVAALASRLFIPESWLSKDSTITGRYAFFGLANWSLVTDTDGYFSPRTDFNIYTHTWSLGVEEQYYVLFPFLFFLYLRNRRPGGSLKNPGFLGLLVLVFASFAYCIFSTRHDPTRAFFLLPSRFWELGVGAIIRMLQADGLLKPLSGGRARGVALSGLLLVLVSLLFADTAQFPFPWAVVPVAGAACLLIAASSPLAAQASLVQRTLASAPAAFIGRISYSLYLWHWPILVLTRWTVGVDTPLVIAVVLGATFLVGWASFRFVETPFLKFSHHPRWPQLAVVAVSLVTICLAFFVHGKVAQMRRLALSQTVDKSEPRIWQVTGRMMIRDGEFMRHRNGGTVWTKRRLFVIGDSHAGAYLTMFQQLAQEKGNLLYLDSKGGRHLGNVVYQMSSAEMKEEKRLLATLDRLAHPGDVVFISCLLVERFCDQWASFDPDDVAKIRDSADFRQKRIAAVADAKRFFAELERRNLTVVIDAPKPVFLSPPFRCSDWFNANNPIGRRGLTIDRALLEQNSRPAMESIAELKQAFPHLRVWDPFPILAGEGSVVSAFRGDKPLFFDGDHLTAYGNSLLYPEFRSFMETIWGSN